MNAACEPTAAVSKRFCPERLEHVFAQCFLASCHTRLIGGAAEPLYQPAAVPGDIHRLWYREDFFSSALHESAHWCIAGRARRELTDFGYWYAPDGRTPEQQQAFESAESGPQALEWLFSQACGIKFHLSVDNLDGLDGDLPDNSSFRQQVLERALLWQKHGLPERAARFYDALCCEFGTSRALAELPLSLGDLS